MKKPLKTIPGVLTPTLTAASRGQNPEIQDAPYLIDIHTTTSKIRMTPIITVLNEQTKKIISGCSSNEIAYMQKPLGISSLIGQIDGGVSLEFNEVYAKTGAAMQEVDLIIRTILDKQAPVSRERNTYRCIKTIPNSVVLPHNAKNFAYIKELNMYPFLLKEKSYTTHQGFWAEKIVREMI
jgi:hypothetical protein